MTVSVLTTSRLVLRPLRPDDAPAIVAGVGDWEVVQWLAVVPHPYGAGDAQRFLSEIVPSAEGVWAIDDGALAGVISVDGELGYWLARDRWGRGYATEAGRAVVDWHFGRGARVLPSGYFDGNHRSGGVLAKLGFQPAGDRVKACVARGKDVLSHGVVMTRAGWRAGQAGLSFRPLGPGDLEALTAIVSEWGVVRNLGTWPWPPDADFTARRAQPYQGEGFVWAVLRHGVMVGTVAVTGPDDQAGVGYMIAPAHQGQGVGTLALRAAVAHAFATRPITGLSAGIWADNVASARMLARAGFTMTGSKMELARARGEMTLSHAFHLTRAAWESLEQDARTG
jgi:RimJ/RimL family protein N-acetyltransferase